MNYPPTADLAQLQLLEALTRMLLHGVLVAMAGASLILLCLYLSELRLPQRCVPEPRDRARKESGAPQPAVRRRASLNSRTPIRHLDTAADSGALWAGGSLPANTAPALWLDRSERGSGWGESLEAR